MNAQSSTYRIPFFLRIQGIVLLVLCGWGLTHYRSNFPQRTIPRFRNHPRVVSAIHDFPLVVTDKQLGNVLHKLRPRFRQPQPKVNFVDHALRLWGDDVTFEDLDCMSGSEMRQMLIDHRAFERCWGKRTRPLLIQDKRGIGWRTQQGNAAISHVDHTLATLAEIGIGLDERVQTPQGEAVMQDLLESAVKRFQLNQPEYEWSALACALYAENLDGWMTTDGQTLNLDLIADRMIREKPNEGVCYGNHRLFTLAALLQIDDQAYVLEGQRWFSPKGRAQVIFHLQKITARLVATQSIEGYWDSNWADVSEPVDEKQQPTARRLLATGHALEWWAIAPVKLQPPRETVIRAAQWLVMKVDQLNDDEVQSNYTFLTHVGRALALWRGGDVATLYYRCRPTVHHDSQVSEDRDTQPSTACRSPYPARQ